MDKKVHISMEEITRYFLNRMSPDEETSVQIHLRECKEYREELDRLRRLKSEFNKIGQVRDFKHIMTSIGNSSWARAAATIVVILGLGIGIFQLREIKLNNEQLQKFEINEGKGGNDVFDVDTMTYQQYSTFVKDTL